MRLTFESDGGYHVTVSSPEVLRLTVAQVEEIAHACGGYGEAGWNDDPEVEDLTVTDRYVTLTRVPHLSVDPLTAETVLRQMRPSTAESLNLIVASNPDDLNPAETRLNVPYSVYDRLSGDDAVVYEGCSAHGSPLCPCEDH